METVSLDILNPDFITVKIDVNLLRDPIKDEMFDSSVQLTQEIPRQMDPLFAEQFTATVEKAN